ncbi:MAG: sulfotransferase family protein [Solirubrobacteraceae bacterium]
MTLSADASVSTDAERGRAPDFFIVGHPKSGTSALFRMLRAHPELHMPRKEPHYFVPELRSSRSTRYSRGISEYISLFKEARADQLIGEATTTYLWSRTAAKRISEVQPQARIIAILREPASFLRSLHLQFLRSHVETEPDLRTAISLDEERREGKRIPPKSTRPQQLVYLDHVRYVEQLRRYHAVFAPEQVLVLIYEDFRADNQETVRKVLRFLEVDDQVAIEQLEVNRAVGIHSPRTYSLVRSLYLGTAPAAGLAKSSIKALTSQRMRRQTMSAIRRMQWDDPPPPDLEFMSELRKRVKGEVVALSEYLNRDMVALWNYDDVE